MFERICLTVQINNFLSYTTVITKYNIQTNYLEYCKVVSAPVKHLRKKCSSNQNLTPLEKNNDKPLLSRESLHNKFIRSLLKERPPREGNPAQGKWLSQEDIFPHEQVNWKNTYLLPFPRATEKTKIISV